MKKESQERLHVAASFTFAGAFAYAAANFIVTGDSKVDFTAGGICGLFSVGFIATGRKEMRDYNIKFKISSPKKPRL